MAKGSFAQNHGVINALEPAADRFATAGNSDVIRADLCDSIVFLVMTGASANNTNGITVEACDDTTPSNTTAIPFKSSSVTVAGTHGAVTDRTTAGFAFTASTANQYHIIEVDPADVEAANSHEGRNYVRCVVTEAGGAVAQLGCIVAIRVNDHFAQDVLRSGIV